MTGTSEHTRRWRQRNPEKYRAQRLREHARHQGRVREARQQVIQLLGGRCARCGIDDVRVLQVDHVHSGGSQERRRLGDLALYRRVLSVGVAEYQLLCANCNWIKREEEVQCARLDT